MKNNRASLTTAQAERLVRNIGDPAFSLGRLDALAGGDGDTSVIQLNLGWQSHIDLYEQLHNNPDKFEVVQETDFGGGRSNVKCVVRYVRKGPWKLEKPIDSEKPSSKKSSSASGKKEEPEEKGVIGFGAVSRPSSEKKKAKKPAKKKAPKKKKKKAPTKKKKSSPKKSRPAKKRPVKKRQPKRKKAKKKSSRS